MIKKLFFFIYIFLIFFVSESISLADLKNEIINKLRLTKTLSFNFNQKIADKEEIGNCHIKYPLFMKCNYKDLKQKTIISNGKTVAIIKKKYKKIYYYPIKFTPLFFILKKDKIINLIQNTEPVETNDGLIKFIFTKKKKNKVKILFDKNTLEFKGWETKDAYANDVSFLINDLKTNNQIVDDFFKIPQEKDL